MTVPTRSRRRTRTIAGIIAGAALVLAAPLAASAHVHVTPDESAAGATTRLAFSFSHGCDDSPTTSLTVTIPQGIDGVKPVLDGAWKISRELDANGIPSRVTFTALAPVDSGISASVAMDVIFASSAANTSVAFPVLQSCVTGSTNWSEVAASGQTEADLKTPAPVVAVGAVAPANDDDHGSSAGHSDGDAHGSMDAAASASGADPVARWLSGGALVAALAALVVTLVRRRRA
ncbi:DUF1775 domain-containing protein [Microbacterium sp. VKM Ac-2870]|uniref:DUF1775 domain-containing protein n=1 Tax=Microbacterium sp. VKM Ac-2870 TaxID=2783825 RepID=UPI00188C5DAC|nr:DUF1775 domain-containing protein [Microbacterium sp. VKM Ac-2870]MBF4561822.1 DUF1775 domain-containing protein [Microbacterium sp. VKM Ac-2870]